MLPGMKLAPAFLLPLVALAAEPKTAWLDGMDLSTMRQGWGTPQVNRAIRETPLSVAGQKFERGVGTHANSTLWLDLHGTTERFQATVGADDAAGSAKASVVFTIIADGQKVFDSGVMHTGTPPKKIDVPLTGMQKVLLRVSDAGDGIEYDHADWADAKFLFTGTPPNPLPTPVESAEIRTPRPGPAPRINGPTIYGCRPGNPFIYRIPTQGERPMKFSADRLPGSLEIDRNTGIIRGTTPARGEYRVTLHARNKHGKSSRVFRIVAGDTLALTPPMGWNHWYAHYDRVTEKMMREAADVMVSSGMADVGYAYVNIDDCWMNAPKHSDPLRVGPLRDAKENLVPNRHFGDLNALTDYIHASGLKAGTYISPGTFTCAGFAGSYKHEAQDARQFADWGFDFLKYDWCSYGHIAEGGDPGATNLPVWVKGAANVEAHKYPYRLMGGLLQQQRRDIVFNLCQYGMADVWEWGAEVGGHCWRTAGDLGFELDRIFEVALKNAEHRAWSRPGAWNDPDYLQIGYVGDARGGGLPRPCPLTPNEQYSYMSLWALMASPLFYSGDMSKLDEFTLNVLCNPEVLDINQDALGQSAAVSMINEETFVMVKDLEDGSKAVGLFNRGEMETPVSVSWAVAGVAGAQCLRDVWYQRDLGSMSEQFTAKVPRHGVVLIRLSPMKR
jgi:alpha-galactosidase